MDKKTHYNSIHKECRVMILCEGPNLTTHYTSLRTYKRCIITQYKRSLGFPIQQDC